MPNLLSASGAPIDAVDVPLYQARSAIYAVVHRETGRVYVGMTSKSVRERWRGHVSTSTGPKRREYFISALRKHGHESFDVYVIEHGIDADLLADRERHYVQAFSATVREFGFNGTTGGDRYHFSPEVRAKIGAAGKGRPVSPEHRAKISASLKGRIRSAEHRANNGAARRGKLASEETKRKLSEAHKGYKASDETRARMSAANRERHAATGVGKKQGEKMRALGADPAYRARVGARIKEAHATPEVKQKMHAAKSRFKDLSDETREKLRAAANRRWSNSDARG